jgi:hypothetical protein
MLRPETASTGCRLVWEPPLAGKPAIEGRISGSAPDAGRIPGVLGMQNVLNGVSMAVGVMERPFIRLIPHAKCRDANCFYSGPYAGLPENWIKSANNLAVQLQIPADLPKVTEKAKHLTWLFI